MNKLISILSKIFNRYKTKKTIKLSTNVTAIHLFDRWKKVTKIQVIKQKNSLWDK